jgi:hypothetical protein
VTVESKVLEIDPQAFRAYFNRTPFPIRHRLQQHPLFALQRLAELSQRLPAKFVEYNAGNLPVGLDPSLTPHNGLSAAETVRRIEQCGSWMVLKRVEQDPEYRALLEDCLDEIGAHARELSPPMFDRQGFIFISSPDAVTPFHIDHEYNFLLQIRGSKRVNIWDADDRFVLPEEKLETFYSDFVHRNLPWQDAFQGTARVHSLAPGDGLHFPVTVPHWVKNGPEVSVSFSVTFRTAESERRERLFKANARLRKLGLQPTPVGASPLVDATKALASETVLRVKKLFGR